MEETREVLFNQHPGHPMKVLWEALKDSSVGTSEVIIAFALDPRCGLERRSTSEEGDMSSPCGKITFKDDATPLMLAVLSGRAEVVNALLVAGANAVAYDRSGRTALHIASTAGCFPVVEILLSRGVDANVRPNRDQGHHLNIGQDDWTPLHCAAAEGHADCVKLLIDALADVNSRDGNGKTPLHHAAIEGHEHCLNLLTNAANVDLDALDNGGQSPLHRASVMGHLRCTEILISRGANLNNQGAIGIPPLHQLMNYYQEASFELILRKGADVNSVDKKGWSLLHKAVSQNDLHTLELLVAYGADVGVKDALGRTPLHVASIYQCGSVMDALLRYGADITALDLDGHTPLLHATWRTDEAPLFSDDYCEELLRGEGA